MHALHQKGKLHGDLKPANLLVTPSGRAVILDFGLATSLIPDDLYDTVELDSRCGTPAYMSPEQAEGQPVLEASDWYSVGVMLYEALAGRLPFRGTKNDVLVQKRLVAARPPSDFVVGVPADLESLCMDLLARSPEDRPTGADVLRRLGIDKADNRATPALTQSRALPFVGRARELRILRDAFEVVKSGQSAQVHVHGLSGIGKTGLVRRFLTRCGQNRSNATERGETRGSAHPSRRVRQAGERGDRGYLAHEVATGFENANMAIHAAATRHRLGELLGGDQGRSMVNAACAVMVAQKIRNPARVAAMLVPGFIG